MKTYFALFLFFSLFFSEGLFAQERSNIGTPNTSSEATNAERNRKVRAEVQNLLQSYLSVMREIGDLNTPPEDRAELVANLVENYLKPTATQTVFIFNSIDPTGKTQKEFEEPNTFFDNLILNYKEGYDYQLDLDNAQISVPKREKDFYYVQVNLKQTLEGRYAEQAQKATIKHDLTFYIRFDLEKVTNALGTTIVVKNPTISRIKQKDFKPTIQFADQMSGKGTAELGKRISFAVQWDATMIDPLRISLFKDGKLVSKLSENAENNLYYWTPAEELKSGSGYKLKISSANDEVVAESRIFSVVDKKYIRVLYPLQGDSLSKGDETTIRWESNLKTKYKVELHRNGVLDRTISAESGKNEVTWTVPKDTTLQAANDYQIRVLALQDTFSVYSEGAFVISNLPTSPFIKVIKPSAATRILRRDKYLIDWMHNISQPDFQIKLYREGTELPIQTLSEKTGANKTFMWKVSPKLPERKDYYLEVSSVAKPDLKIKSNLFTIQKRSPWKWVGIGAGAILTGVLIGILTQTVEESLPLAPDPGGE